MSKTALVLGGSGETGSEVLKLLAQTSDYAKIRSLGRRKLLIFALEKLEQEVIDFDSLEASEDKFKGIDVAFICLGTTIEAEGQEGFVKVDHDYVVNAATMLQKNGCQSMHLLSCSGAEKDAARTLYGQTKGQVEAAITDMGFPMLAIYRPGLLMCDRNDDLRTGESWMRWVASWMSDAWSVKTSTVARAMVETSLSLKSKNEMRILEHADILEFD